MSDDGEDYEPAALDDHKEDPLDANDDEQHKLDPPDGKHGDDHMELPHHGEDDTIMKVESPVKAMGPPAVGRSPDDELDDEADLLKGNPTMDEEDELDEKTRADMELIKTTMPSTQLEHALSDALNRKDLHVLRLTNEIRKLKGFISKRKQTYKRKRKEEGAPTRALSGYNIFIQDRFKRLAKENELALRSTDSDAKLKRVPPANLVAATGGEWKNLPPEEKAKYEERAKGDKARYEEQIAKYQPPDRATNRKRNKTGCTFLWLLILWRMNVEGAL